MLLETYQYAPTDTAGSPKSKPKITIIDRPCGSGKTSAMLKSFQPDKKYLVVTPLLSEVDRVVNHACVPFCQPQADHEDRKMGSILELLKGGSNVATSHKLYADLALAVDRGLLDDYEIIIDEVPAVVEQVTGITAESWFKVYVDGGFATVDEQGVCRPTDKWSEELESVQDTLKTRLFFLASAGCLHVVNDRFFLWALPPRLLAAGRSVTVYTYLAEGSMLLAYLRKLRMPFFHDTSPEEDTKFRSQARSLVLVRSIPGLDQYAWSFNAQTAGRDLRKRERRTAKALANLRHRELRDIPLESIMLTCPKTKWYRGGQSADRETAKAAGYAVDSRMFRARWVPNTTRGTNDYVDCKTAIYLYDQYPNPFIQQWLGTGGDREARDRYALAEFVQWLYRTAVRRGEPVTVYVPCKRMRDIFEEWLSTGAL